MSPWRKALSYLHPLRLLRVTAKLILATLAAIYFVVNRSFLFLLAVYVSLYFFVGSSSFTNVIERALGGEIPGFLTFANAQWGPDPTELRVAHVRIMTEKNQEVVHAPAAVFTLDLAGTAAGAIEGMIRRDAPITVLVDKAVVADAFVWVEVRDNGDVGIHKAFDKDGPPRDPSLPPPRNLDIHIDSVELHDTHGWLESPHFNVEFENLDLTGDFHVIEYPGTVNYDIPLAHIGKADIFFKPHVVPGNRPQRLLIPVRDMDVTMLQWRASRFNVARVEGKLPEGTLSFRGMVETDPDRGRRIDGTAVIGISAESDLLQRFFGQVLPLSGAMQLTVNGVTDIQNWADAEVLLQSRQLKLGDLTLSDVDSNFEVSPVLSPAGHYDHRIDIRRLAAQTLGGRVSVTKATYSGVDSSQTFIRPNARRHVLDVTLALQQVNPWALISSSLLGGSDLVPTLPFLDGRLNGRLQLAASLDQGSGVLALQTRTEGLTMNWEGGQRGLPLSSRYGLKGGVRYTFEPPLTPTNDGLAARERVTLTDFGLVSGGDSVGVDGGIDLVDQTLDLTANARIGNLARFIGTLGGSGVAGRFRLSDAKIGGTFDDPAVRGTIRITNAELDGRTIGTISGTVDLSNGMLSLADLSSNTPFGSVKAGGRIRLWRDSLERLDPRLPFVVTRLDVDALDLGKLAPQLGILGVFDVDLRRPVKGAAAAPMKTLLGEVNVAARNITLAGERARRIQGRIIATKDRIRLKDGLIALCRDPPRKGKPGAKCRKGGPNIKATAHVYKRFDDRRGPRFKAHLKTRNLPLRTINVFAGVDDLRGEATADVQIEGRFSAPRFFGTVGLRDFGVGNVELGDAQLDLTWGRAGEIVVTAMQFFDNMTLQESLIDITKGRFKARFDAEIKDLAVFSRLLPALELHPTIDIVGSGKGRFELDPMGRVPWRLRFDAAAGDVTVTVNDGRTRYVSADRVRYRMVPDLLRVVQPVKLVSGKNRDLYVCGGIQDSRWDVELAGEVGTELLTPLAEVRDLVSSLSGSVLIAADVDTANRRGRSGCMQRAGNNIALVRGELARPTFDGTFTTNALTFVPRNLGRQVTFDDGAHLKLRPTNRIGRQLVRVDKGKRALKGEIDDGRFNIFGDLYLQDLTIDDANLTVSGSEIYWASAGEYSLAFNPDVTLNIDDFGDDANRRIDMRGDVLVTEGKYFKSFDSFARAFGAVAGGEGEGYERPLTERVPWLKSLRMNLDVRSNNLAVQSAFPTGKLDLEARLDINVAGTLDTVQVRRRVDILPDGTISYNLFQRDFEVRNGYLEFDGDEGPRIELRAEAEVEYLQARGAGRPDEERQVTVIVLISGRLPDDLNIELSSQPGGFTQADLERLIVTGKPLQDQTSAFEDNLFSFDLGSFVNRLLKAPFVDAVRLGLTQEGFVDTQIVTKFGRDVSLRTRAVQEAGDSTRLSARFEFRLTDNVVLEGRAIRSTGNDFVNNNDRYEARIKYRIPLD